jgi:hypothetical protein
MRTNAQASANLPAVYTAGMSPVVNQLESFQKPIFGDCRVSSGEGSAKQPTLHSCSSVDTRSNEIGVAKTAGVGLPGCGGHTLTAGPAPIINIVSPFMSIAWQPEE